MSPHPRNMLALLAIALFIAACGGGSDSPDATEAKAAPAATDNSADTSTLVASADARKTTQAATATDTPATDWVACAAEGARCNYSGLRQVRYGTPTKFKVRELNGPVSCNNATFGDPAYGLAKSCSYSTTVWTACAAEGGTCSFDGTRQVRYGTASKYAVGTYSNIVVCSNKVFGDPASNVYKGCWVSGAALAVPAPAPAPVSPPVPVPPAPVAEAPSADDCMAALPPLPTLPASHKLVTSFCKNGYCARPDDGIDDTDAIDEALNQSAGSFLVFPPGQYQISRSLRVKRSGITLWGPGATIHATNWDDQSIIVEANDTSIYAFRLTAVTGQRGGRAEHTRIAIYGPASVNPVVRNTVIRGNQIVNAGAPGTSLANASTGAGIFVHRADGFLIAGNTVVRTLADGIHLTGGARNGRVIGNTVRETGDDMIAMVSYAYPNPATGLAASIASVFPTSLANWQVSNIAVLGNDLSGQYWGRGIAVVGGRDITIRNNRLSNIPYGAAVLLARETQSGTYGLDNIVVEQNSISEVQTQHPAYDFGGKFASHARTGHGAIEVHASIFRDELLFPSLASGFSVQRLAIRNNTISATSTPAVRIGVDSGANWTFGQRAVTGAAPMSNIAVDGNVLSAIRNGSPVQVLNGDDVATCQADRLDGNPLSVAHCADRPSAAPATGAVLACPQG